MTGGMPLAFMQEDFLVLNHFVNICSEQGHTTTGTKKMNKNTKLGGGGSLFEEKHILMKTFTYKFSF